MLCATRHIAKIVHWKIRLETWNYCYSTVCYYCAFPCRPSITPYSSRHYYTHSTHHKFNNLFLFNKLDSRAHTHKCGAQRKRTQIVIYSRMARIIINERMNGIGLVVIWQFIYWFNVISLFGPNPLFGPLKWIGRYDMMPEHFHLWDSLLLRFSSFRNKFWL